MKNVLLLPLFILCITHTLQAYETHSHEEGNNTNIQINSVRGILGENNPIQHSHGQVRAGYITLKETNNQRDNAYALAGHFHLDSKKWEGLEVGLSGYTVLNLATQQNPTHLNGDFFDSKGDSFILLSEAYLKGNWGNTELILGRQILNTPHADSDDIRMIPNYFEAYTIRNTDISELTLAAGFIRKMAGWENGVDSSLFVNIGSTLGVEPIDGTLYASILYDGIKDLSLSFWYYYYTNTAEVAYTEMGYTLHPSKYLDITFGLQYDASWQIGVSQVQEHNARTFGVSMELVSEHNGLHLLMAYNNDNGNSGASTLSLGGGPLFTSMEDQTLDAVGEAAEAWIIGLGYHFKNFGIKGLNAGLAYGSFKSNKTSNYHVKEVDTIIKYDFSKKFSALMAYADVDFQTNTTTDYKQLRVIINYNF